MNQDNRVSALVCAGVVLGLAVGHSEAAEEQSAKLLEEVVVTATRRETDAQSTPVAVTAISSEDRDRLGLRAIQDIAAFAPGVSYQSNPNRFTIRGIGRLDNAIGSDPGVATYVDGTYTSETVAIGRIPLFVERTEILRGPQGTLFGRNSVGGLVNVITRRPDDEFNLDLQLRAEEFDNLLLATSITGPITDKVRYRVNYRTSDRDGFQDNLGSGPDPDSEDIEFAEVQLEADLTDRLSVWLRYNRSETDNQPNIDALRAPYATSVFQGALVPFAQFGLSNNPAEFDNRRVRTDHDGFSRLDADQVTLEVSYAFDQFELKYIGSYNEYEFSYSRDADDTDQASIDYPLVDPATFLPIPLSVSTYAVNHIEENKEFTSHELQFITSGEGRLQFIGGLYYYEEDIDQPFHLRLPFEPALQTPFSFVTFGPGNANPDGDFYYQLGSIESEAFAAYGQFDLELSDRLNLTLGLRYTEDEKDGYEEQRIVLYNPAANVFGAFGFPLPPTTSIDISLNGNGPATRSLENEWDAVTGKIGLDFQLNEDILFYGYAARGYKSGGMRLGQLEGLDLTQPGGISLSNSPFVDEETVWAYEAGMKSDLADGKLRLNLTAFYYDYEDQQAPVSFTDTTGVVLQDFINVPETSSYGFEAETIWYPTDNLQLIANYGYLKAEIEADLLLVDNALPVPETVNVKGNVLPKSPEHKVTLAASYYLDTAIGNFNFTANWSRYSEQYASFFERDLYEIDSYSIAGARITYWTNDESLRVILGVNNLTDEDAPTETLRAATAENGFARVEAPLAPRVVFLELTKSFGS